MSVTVLAHRCFDCARNPVSKVWRYCIANLDVLFSSWPAEEVIVWKGLKPCGLPDRKAASLHRVGVNEVMSILGNVTGDGGGRLLCNLNLEAVEVGVCFKAVPIHFYVLMNKIKI